MNINDIIVERPVGTEANKKVCNLVKEEAAKAELSIISLPFDCLTWEKQASFVRFGNSKIEIFPSPFSQPVKSSGELVKIQTVEELGNTNLAGKIVLLHGELSQEPLMPKDFPFYYPDNHKNIIDRLESSSAVAVIAVTDKHPMCGLSPYPMFEDGNFTVPSAFVGIQDGAFLMNYSGSMDIEINSIISKAVSEQVVASKYVPNGKGKIVVCAHLDSMRDTPGAIDNAAGVYVLSRMMQHLKNYSGDYDIEFVPFNGEEYFGETGQLAYLEYIKTNNEAIKLVVNIDSPGHFASKTALSFYNFDDKMNQWIDGKMTDSDILVKGEEWYAGDHAMFAFQGIPCIAVTSSNLMETVLSITHTPADKAENLSLDILDRTAEALADLVNSFAE